ncbi:S-adenosyl-L-methionine-dependent methyltransferase [Pholiota conissans]|uniref:S-adenosyl-L-methionine-dependent methyltransferase n=1 Tax=Pholiota conissans TaxID=109636 RepID=A0A9P5ZBI1_9AGAR|nr:S-adenosyl-L-methionine-dependent methyltransferase [Pholiota conissans]
MPAYLFGKDVENALRRAHKHKRRHGEIPYPITYSKEMADFDIWDHMLLTTHFGNLTCHRFDKPPALTLDIGCGAGFWAIDAAKKWQKSHIIGFDIAKVQPRLHDIVHQKELARRVEWVHGNLLDGLPFPGNHFDFVRMAGLGLAIPEDEWQSVLEEIHRVMKPKAVLEIIEEDLLFPCSSALLQKPKPPSSFPALAHQLHALDMSKNKSTTFSDQSSMISSPPKSPSSPMASLASLHEYLKGGSKLASQPSLYVPEPSTVRYPPSIPSNSSSATQATLDNSDHPQDHTRLKLSWEAMLSTRFLSPKVVAVLPFYLTSAFVDTRIHPPLQIPLPPNSGRLPNPSLRSYQSMSSIPERSRVTRDRSVSDTFFDLDFDFASTARSNKADGCSFRSSFQMRSQAANWDTMHLAKSLSMITGCKEAIWEEYNKLYYNEAMAILMRTAPIEEEYEMQPYKHVVRKAFEVDWRNWEYDMLDRIQMRNSLLRHVPWVQASTPDEQPPCQTWRQRLEPGEANSTSGHFVTAYNPDDLCRSLRVFTCFKS